jgi:hypothetical protein
MELIPTTGLLRWITTLLQFALDYFQPENRLVRRITRIYRAHGISRPQICGVIPHYSLSPTSFSSINNAKALITKDLISETSALFNVNRSWLEGNETSLSNDIGTYGSPISDIQEQLKSIQLIESDTHLKFLHLILPSNIRFDQFETHTTNYPIALAYRVSHERDGIDFDTYHNCEILCWDYQKSRIHLRAILRLADTCNFQLRGAFAPIKYIQSFDEGKICFSELRKYCRKPCDPWNYIVNNSDSHEKKLLKEFLATR